MSLLIEKMIIPEQGAYEARLVVFKEGKASLSIVTGNVITTYDVSEIPPHGDLIDRDALLRTPINLANYPSSWVNHMPAIIEKEDL